MKKQNKEIPKKGDDIYIGSELYLGHGVDDFSGGLCKIIEIGKSKMYMGNEGLEHKFEASKENTKLSEIFVEVKERPGHYYNLEHLLENQEKWKKDYGKRRGKPDPDYSPMFNRWD